MTQPRRNFRRDPAWTNHVEVVEPIEGASLSGGHYWDGDRLAHARDTPAFCPACAASLAELGALAVEYWERDRRVYHVRCAGCGWTGDIARVARMIGPDAPH